MRRMSFVLAACLAVVTAQADAKGRKSSGGGPKSQYVHAYTRADGTHVNGYYRSGPVRGGGITHAPGATAGLGGFDSDDPTWAEGLGKQASSESAPKTKCVYSDVMTDDEIAACR